MFILFFIFLSEIASLFILQAADREALVFKNNLLKKELARLRDKLLDGMLLVVLPLHYTCWVLCEKNGLNPNKLLATVSEMCLGKI